MILYFTVRRPMKIESIPAPGARVYAVIARKGSQLRDLHNAVAEEVTATLTTGRILDVGTGPGYLPVALALRAPRLAIDGIDLSPAMVTIARNNTAKSGVGDRVTFQCANAADLPFADNSFDLVLSTLSLHHWSQPLECLTEIHRVLKPQHEAWIYDARRDTTKEVNATFRRTYGWFLAFLFLKLVRAHSSVTLHEVETLLASPSLPFSSTHVIDQGVFLKLQLVK
jgi:ubiquinone/menaquinone biosynthesis C-methylase UbiE